MLIYIPRSKQLINKGFSKQKQGKHRGFVKTKCFFLPFKDDLGTFDIFGRLWLKEDGINRLCFVLLSWYVFSHCLCILCLILDECFCSRLLTKTISGNENMFEISQAVDVLNGVITPSRF